VLKGFKKVWPDIVDILGFLPQDKKPSFLVALIFGALAAVVTYAMLRFTISKKVIGMEGRREEINLLFTVPLIFAAALLSFAHGANDVANAVGPLAAVYDALSSLAVSEKAAIPLWVMATGGVGISVGLALFGPRLIKTVGSEITELDQMRAFSIMMASAITVIIASQFGLPVSSTHIVVGAIFGVGFLREWLESKEMGTKEEKLQVELVKQDTLKHELTQLKTVANYKRQVALKEALKLQKKKVKIIKSSLRKNYVKRGMVKKIVAAWVITVPASAMLSAIIFYIIRGVSF